MKRTERHVQWAAALAGGLAFAGAANGQASIKPDGQWRHAIGAGLSYASGNSESATLTINADGVRRTDVDKWTYYGKALRARTDGDTTGDQLGLGTRYEKTFNKRYFGFGQGDFLRDRPANLSQRFSVGAGLGYHVVKSDRNTWDVFSGLGYTNDNYVDAVDIGGQTRTSWGYAELVVGQESNHQLSETASFRQRFVVFPNLSETGDYRAQLDAGLSVAINARMSLTATLTYRYNSDPGGDLEKTDVLFVTGVSAKIE
jgi:putative salt-induced outer membrane protein YdiY